MTIQHCHLVLKRAKDKMQMKGHGCVPIKLYLKKSVDLVCGY
jgi:hypothetical protein